MGKTGKAIKASGWSVPGWSKLVLVGVGGVIFVAFTERCVPTTPPWWSVIHESLKHVGMALLVAVVLGLFLQLGEVKDHLSEYAKTVLIQGEYLKGLNPDTLFRLRSTIASVLFQKVVSNDEYEHQEIHQQFENVLFGKLVHSDSEGEREYRRNYSDVIHFEFLTSEQLAKRYRLLGDEPNEHRLYVTTTTSTTYEVVSPHTGRRPYVVPLLGDVNYIRRLLHKDQVQYHIGATQQTMKLVEQVKFDLTQKEGLLHYEAREELNYSEAGTLTVCTQVIEVELAEEVPFMLKSMARLTHAPSLTITTSNNVPTRLLQVFMLGLGSMEPVQATPGMAKWDFSGWMAEGQGFLIYWSPSAILASLGAPHSTKRSMIADGGTGVAGH